jgi:hypothetical protein
MGLARRNLVGWSITVDFARAKLQATLASPAKIQHVPQSTDVRIQRIKPMLVVEFWTRYVLLINKIEPGMGLPPRLGNIMAYLSHVGVN